MSCRRCDYSVARNKDQRLAGLKLARATETSLNVGVNVSQCGSYFRWADFSVQLIKSTTQQLIRQ